jgi:hypothetical protein
METVKINTMVNSKMEKWHYSTIIGTLITRVLVGPEDLAGGGDFLVSLVEVDTLCI